MRTKALRISAVVFWPTRTEMIVLAMANSALNTEANIINSDVLTITPMSRTATPSSITTCVRRGIARSTTTMPVISSIASRACHR